MSNLKNKLWVNRGKFEDQYIGLFFLLFTRRGQYIDWSTPDKSEELKKLLSYDSKYSQVITRSYDMWALMGYIVIHLFQARLTPNYVVIQQIFRKS